MYRIARWIDARWPTGVWEDGELTVSLRLDAATCVIELYGEFDLSGVELFRTALSAAEGETNEIVVDLSGLDFMDSTAVAEFVHAHERAMNNGHEVAFLRGSAKIERITEITGLDQVLRFED